MSDEIKQPERKKTLQSGENKPEHRSMRENHDKKPANHAGNTHRTFDKVGNKPSYGHADRHDGERRFGSSGEKRLQSGDKTQFNRENAGENRKFPPKNPGFRNVSDAKVADKPYPAHGDRPHAARPGEGHAPRPYDRNRPQGERPAFRSAPRPAAPVRKAPPTDGLPARRMALDVIRQVTENGAYASLALDEKLKNCTLSHEDRRLVSRLVYDTLEHLLYLDHAIGQVMAKPDTDIKLRNVLRLGACQILLEDRIPESAATNTSVNLCKEIGMEGLGGVCNGILRNLVRRKDELSWPDEATEPVKALSVRYSVPEWLVERLLADWGHDTAIALMDTHREDTPITIRPNVLMLDDAAFEQLLEKKVWQHERAKLPHAWYIRNMVDVSRDADFVAGRFSIQNESSMMSCLAAAPKRGMAVLDCCAAPGGKSCLMAEMMGGTGRVQSWDVHEHRVALIEAQVRRLKLENVRPLVRDATRLREDLIESMDVVLLDAPCSGTGDMADKPDVKYRPTPESLTSLTETQRQLLDTVSSYVKRGGVLVYSTCSVLKEENEYQIRAFLERHPEFKLEPLPETIPERFRQYQDVGLQLMPKRDGVGGFYIARLKRKVL